jgi:hypothetical protein
MAWALDDLLFFFYIETVLNIASKLTNPARITLNP